MDPAGSEWSAIRWLGTTCFAISLLFGCIQLVALAFSRSGPKAEVAVMSYLIVAFCMATSALRIAYLNADPFQWLAQIDNYAGLVTWTLDYASTATIGIALLLVLYQWSTVVEQMSKVLLERKLVKTIMRCLKVFCVGSIALILVFLILSCVFARICDGEVCSYELSDQVLFIPWIILLGIASLSALIIVGLVIRWLRRHPEKYSRQLLRFSAFVVFAAISMVLLVVFVVILFSTEYGDRAAFLWIEGLQMALFVVQLLAIQIVVSTGVRATIKEVDNRRKHLSQKLNSSMADATSSIGSSSMEAAMTGDPSSKSYDSSDTQTSIAMQANQPIDKQWDQAEYI